MKKQPLKEMLKAIGGEHLLNENNISNINKLYKMILKVMIWRKKMLN